MRLDNTDKKILQSIYHNWRITVSDIARKTKLSRRQVDYRLKEYERIKIIRSFFLAVDYAKLGFPILSYAFIRIKGGSDIQAIGKALTDSKRCTSWGKAWSKYDIWSNWAFSSKEEQDHLFRKLKSKFHAKISDLTVVEAFHAEFFPLRIVDNSHKESYALNPSKSVPEKLDPLDRNILKYLASNARAPIVCVANQVGISPELCVYRLRRLHAKGIILGSRVQFDLSKAGYFATCLFLDLKKPRAALPKFQSLCIKLPDINYLIVSEKSPNAIVQVFHKDESTLRSAIKEIKRFCVNDLESLDLVQLDDDISIVDPVPFL